VSRTDHGQCKACSLARANELITVWYGGPVDPPINPSGGVKCLAVSIALVVKLAAAIAPSSSDFSPLSCMLG
jgi:hypothetical protein